MPVPAPRLASIQPASSQPSKSVLTGPVGRGQRGAADVAMHWQDWQNWIRQFAHDLSTVRFAGGTVADQCGGCDLLIEERDPNGDWVPSENPLWARTMESYKNAQQGPNDLVRLQAWFYSTSGELVQCRRDVEGALAFELYSTQVIDWNKPHDGMATVKLIPNGRVDAGTAFVVPIDQVIRLWTPDEEYAAWATSPMASSVDDLRRWKSLARYAWKMSESRIAMQGLMVVDKSVDDGHILDLDDDDEGAIGNDTSWFESRYYELARLALDQEEDVASIAPPLALMDLAEGKAPSWVQVGPGLDKSGIEHRHEALEDAARSWPVPNTITLGGGMGDANHWNEWKASDVFIDNAIKPMMNRICHVDLTHTFLWPLARANGIPDAQVVNVRVGYDPTPVIIKPDRSDLAIKALTNGVIGFVTAREWIGASEDDAPTDEELNRLIAIQSKGAAGALSPAEPGADGTGLPAGPGNVVEGAPPAGPPAANGNGTAPAAPTPALGAARVGYFDEAKVVREHGKFAPKDVSEKEGTDLGPRGLSAADPIIHTDADAALEDILDGKYVEMDPNTLSVALDKLAQIGIDAKALGEKAPLYDVCKISVSNSNLFCAESVVGSRLDMPQLSGVPTPGSAADALPKNDKGEVDLGPGFRAMLEGEGVKVDDTTEAAVYLKATQNELNGVKVGGMASVLDSGQPPAAVENITAPIFVSRDNYVIDGHHRWAAQVAEDWRADQSFGELQMSVARIDLPVQQILDRANDYATKMGIPPAQASVSSVRVAALLESVLARHRYELYDSAN